jgi:hypothetical protein
MDLAIASSLDPEDPIDVLDLGPNEFLFNVDPIIWLIARNSRNTSGENVNKDTFFDYHAFVFPPADLSLTQSVQPPVLVGRNLVYTLEVTNKGSSKAPGVRLEYTYFYSLIASIVASIEIGPVDQGGCSNGTNIGYCDIGTLEVGEKARIKISVDPNVVGTSPVLLNVKSHRWDLDEVRTLKDNTTSLSVGHPGFLSLGFIKPRQP